jgi:hypothetical protein
MRRTETYRNREMFAMDQFRNNLESARDSLRDACNIGTWVDTSYQDDPILDEYDRHELAEILMDLDRFILKYRSMNN